MSDNANYRQENAAKARAARTRQKHSRMAEELREAGWQVSPPIEITIPGNEFGPRCVGRPPWEQTG